MSDINRKILFYVKIFLTRQKKRNKYFLVNFIWIFVLIIMIEKFDHTVAGMPIPGKNWDEIFRDIFSSLGITFFMSFLVTQVMYENHSNEKKRALKSKRKKIAIVHYASYINSHECRVCGFYVEDYPWGEDGKSPAYQICPCCGVQFGKEDITLDEIKKYRTAWVNKGGKWYIEAEKPEEWDMEEQMKNIPEKFK